jgi:hypothetical protein
VSEQLTDLERAVFDKLLAGENSELKILREQFSKATVSTRELTENGFFTTLKIPAVAVCLQRKGRVTITDVSADLPQLKHGVGFVMFIDDGKISCLEGFCYDESWPDSSTDFELSYLQELPHGSGKLTASKKRDIEFALKDFAA